MVKTLFVFERKEFCCFCILKGGTVWGGHHDDGKGSHTYDCGNYSIYLDEEIADEDRPIMIFEKDSPVSDELKRKVLEEVVHYDKDIGYVEDFNDDRVWQVTVDEESIHRSRIDSDYIEGVVNVNQESYSFDYNPETDEIEIHKYSEPGWMTGASHEVDLPSEFEGPQSNEIYIEIGNAVEEYLEKEKIDKDLDEER